MKGISVAGSTVNQQVITSTAATPSPGDKTLKFVVNGVSLNIDTSAKSVNISKDSISIDF